MTSTPTSNLTGSPKQVDWATKIRAAFQREGQDVLAKMENATDEQMRGADVKAKAVACCRATLALAETQTEAAWWINGGSERSFILEMRAQRAKFNF